MKNAAWSIVRAAIGEVENPPAWLKELARQNYEEIAQLPKLDNAAQGQTASPVIEEKEVAMDYLDFLREQIHLNARGPEWTKILQEVGRPATVRWKNDNHCQLVPKTAFGNSQNPSGNRGAFGCGS